jgi:triphosphoribosyl-dephospho-CoA synthase
MRLNVNTTSTTKTANLRSDVAVAGQLACLLEASAPKPGNVSPGRNFDDVTYEDFLASAAAIGGPLADAGVRPLGETILRSVEATARWTRSNTNLGIILVLAPLARAACQQSAGDLRARVQDVLASTTVEDARKVYQAIRRANPGGMGRVDVQDVSDEPTVTLLDAMRLAADRDGIAREYATAFAVTFDLSVPALERARRDGLGWNDAIVETFLILLADAPDTHIVRRRGSILAAEVSDRARVALSAGGVRSTTGRTSIAAMDAALRDARHVANPGTTADLIAAAIFAVLLSSECRPE